MIARRRLAAALGAAAAGLGAWRPALAQPSARLRRVAILQAATADARRNDAFRQGMQDLGWHQGRNVEYLFAAADGDTARLDELAAALVARQPEVILNSSGISTRALQRATRTIPIVMVTVANPVGAGFVASLAHPGGNITGLTNQQEEVLPKVVQVLHEMVPAARRVAVVLSENNPSHGALWASAREACAALQLVPLRVVASTPSALEGAVAQLVAEGAQAVVVTADPMYTSTRERIQQLMQAARLPVAYGLREHVVAGGLMSYGVNFIASWRYAAKYVDAILKGARPAELPVEQPTTFEFVINLKTARALGITIPQSVLLRADEVIE